MIHLCYYGNKMNSIDYPLFKGYWRYTKTFIVTLFYAHNGFTNFKRFRI